MVNKSVFVSFWADDDNSLICVGESKRFNTVPEANEYVEGLAVPVYVDGFLIEQVQVVDFASPDYRNAPYIDLYASQTVAVMG